MDSKKEKLLKKTFDDYIDLMLYDFPVERMGDLIAEDVSGYGTTVDEKFLEIKRFKKVVTDQREQGAGIEMQIRIKPIHRRISPDEDTALFMDEFEITMVIDGAKNVLPLRLTSVFEFLENKWKLVHIHGSKAIETEGDTWHMEEWKKKNEELQRLVDEKTLDLVKKNRELEIEAALERVRTVTMSMQTPDDLLDVCQIISEQLELLNVSNIRNVQVAIVDEPKKNYLNYQYFTAYSQKVFEVTEYENHPASQAMVDEMQKSVNSFFSGKMEGEALDGFRKWRKQYDQFPDPLLDKSEAVYYYFYSIGKGGLGLTTYEEISYENLDIFKRFHKVFTLTYRRFMDIQLAESQVREAQVELSLERIRAQVTAMSESSELLDIVVMMQTEFTKLGHEAHYFWHMRWFPDKYEKALTNGDGTRIGNVLELPRGFHGLKNMMDWERSDEPTAVFALDPETAADYIDKMIKLGRFQEIDHSAPGPDDVRAMGGLTFVMARTTHGEIGYTLPGVVPDPPDEDIATLARFAVVFDLAYKRFEDLKTAEKDLIEIKAARQKAEEALAELNATQAQLIHTEKMASLGELTAGIAHEIQNPLNFVNNFSEVSIELIDELKQDSEVRSQKSEVRSQKSAVRSQQSVMEIIDDIRQNLDKILHHGKRADAIVKGMLQHSRSSSGQKEPTDINALADEYLRLAYHGLRAKDKSFNATMITDFDETIGKISIIPQDIGRVILNLITNAFYAVDQKKKQLASDLSALPNLTGQNSYEPTVTVSTNRSLSLQGEGRGEVLISVKDNGNGIPEEITDKIFQPFFTTKPTGQGTGLGLSLSYDIVKAHSGELKVETKEGTGSEFIIRLQIQ